MACLAIKKTTCVPSPRRQDVLYALVGGQYVARNHFMRIEQDQQAPAPTAHLSFVTQHP
jgi:hypothetical protein